MFGWFALDCLTVSQLETCKILLYIESTWESSHTHVLLVDGIYSPYSYTVGDLLR